MSTPVLQLFQEAEGRVRLFGGPAPLKPLIIYIGRPSGKKAHAPLCLTKLFARNVVKGAQVIYRFVPFLLCGFFHVTHCHGDCPYSVAPFCPAYHIF